MTRPVPPTRILWASSRQQLACATHAPPVASPEWWGGSWRLFSEHEQIGFERAAGHAPECTACLALVEFDAMTVPVADGAGGAA